MSEPVRVYVGADVATHELMRFALKEIVRRHQAEPYGFTAAEAAEMASRTLLAVDQTEKREGAPHA